MASFCGCHHCTFFVLVVIAVRVPYTHVVVIAVPFCGCHRCTLYLFVVANAGSRTGGDGRVDLGQSKVRYLGFRVGLVEEHVEAFEVTVHDATRMQKTHALWEGVTQQGVTQQGVTQQGVECAKLFSINNVAPIVHILASTIILPSSEGNDMYVVWTWTEKRGEK